MLLFCFVVFLTVVVFLYDFGFFIRHPRGMIREASHRGPRGPHINNVAVLFCRFPYGCRFPIRLRFFHTTSNKSNDRVPEHSFRRKRGILKRVVLTFVCFGGGVVFVGRSQTSLNNFVFCVFVGRSQTSLNN